MRSLYAAAIAVALLLCVVPLAQGHEDPGEQIAALSAQIAQHPDDAALYMRRADLRRIRREWPEALADLQAVNGLDPVPATADLLAARVLLEADNPHAALAAIDRFVARDGSSAAGHLLRARILVHLGSSADAAAEFTRGIDLARAAGTRAQPDDYLDRARALSSGGAMSFDEAIRGLDEGTNDLGAAIALQLYAIDLEVERHHWDAALARLAALQARATRKESWIERRADILLLAGRRPEARQCYLEAQAAVQKLPERLRTTRAITDMAQRIQFRLSSLDASAGTHGALAGEDGAVASGQGALAGDAHDALAGRQARQAGDDVARPPQRAASR